MLNTNLSKTQLYWLLQFAGWTAYFMMSGLIYANNFGFTPKLIINLAVNILLNILATHFYRFILIQANWLRFPLLRLLFISFGVAWLLAIPLAVINIRLDEWTFKVYKNNINFATMYDYGMHIVKAMMPWMAIYVFFTYIEKLRVLEVEKYQLQAALKEDQLRYLKNQVNPHFLFNALNSIRTLVDVHPEESKRAITNLGKFLRNTLVKSEASTIRLEEELQIVQDYLSLEKIRFDERLKVNYKIAADTLDINIPPMVIQTLVENAIKHGISKLKKGGVITISSYLLENDLHITIENSGSYATPLATNGVGLKNTEQRLRLIFGAEAAIKISNTINETVCTELQLPL